MLLLPPLPPPIGSTSTRSTLRLVELNYVFFVVVVFNYIFLNYYLFICVVVVLLFCFTISSLVVQEKPRVDVHKFVKIGRPGYKGGDHLQKKCFHDNHRHASIAVCCNVLQTSVCVSVCTLKLTLYPPMFALGKGSAQQT